MILLIGVAAVVLNGSSCRTRAFQEPRTASRIWPRRRRAKRMASPISTGIWIVPGAEIFAESGGGPEARRRADAALGRGAYQGAHDAALTPAEESDANCLPQGVPKINVTPVPFKIVQNPDEVIILYEAFGIYRQIFMDGRELPKDPNPSWMGYSVGKWEGDALVVTTSGFNGKAWLDQAGPPADRSVAGDRALPAAGFRTFEYRGDHQRSEGVHQALDYNGRHELTRRYRLTRICL